MDGISRAPNSPSGPLGFPKNGHHNILRTSIPASFAPHIKTYSVQARE